MARKKILYVATVPALESYSAGIISSAFLNDELDVYAFICLEAKDKRNESDLQYQYGIPADKQAHIMFIYLSENKLIKLLSSGKYLQQAFTFAQKNQVKIVHFISQDIMLAGYYQKFLEFQTYYTVHDLVHHEGKRNLLRKIRHYFLFIRKDKKLVRQFSNLVTNNLGQMERLKQLYPWKNIVFHQMPGLVTHGIKSGEQKIEKLKTIQNYILFFGRIELYKGLEQLYNTFINTEELKDQILVIAGSGKVYFKRHLEKEKNVIFINRYIEEPEINDLFSKAKMLILPYLSATQSAVTSLAYHYHLPVIGSAVNGIKDTIIPGITGLIYSLEDQDELRDCIMKLLDGSELNVQIGENLKKNRFFYDQNDLKNQIAGIYVD
jgi:glycosyltransferase involved in cell wall biosynthesis